MSIPEPITVAKGMECALIGQAQATRSSPWEPGNEVKPTQVWRTENGREEVVSPQKNQSIVARKMRECVQAKRKSQLPILSYRSSVLQVWH